MFSGNAKTGFSPPLSMSTSGLKPTMFNSISTTQLINGKNNVLIFKTDSLLPFTVTPGNSILTSFRLSKTKNTTRLQGNPVKFKDVLASRSQAGISLKTVQPPHSWKNLPPDINGNNFNLNVYDNSLGDPRVFSNGSEIILPTCPPASTISSSCQTPGMGTRTFINIMLDNETGNYPYISNDLFMDYLAS